MKWIKWPNKNLQATKIIKKIRKRIFLIIKNKKLTLGPNKIVLFLQATDGKLQEKLEILLEGNEKDDGLILKWRVVEDAIRLFAKRKQRTDRIGAQRVVKYQRLQCLIPNG